MRGIRPPLWTVHGVGKAIAVGAVVAPDERLSWPRTRADRHAARYRDVRCDVVGADDHGVPCHHHAAVLRRRHCAVFADHRWPDPELPRLVVRVHHPAHRVGVGRPAAQLGGVLAVGVVLALVGVVVRIVGARLLDAVMPPVVTGAVVALIGLNLSTAAVGSFEMQPLVAAVTLAAILLAMVGVRLGDRCAGHRTGGRTVRGGLVRRARVAWTDLRSVGHPACAAICRGAGRGERRARQGCCSDDRTVPWTMSPATL